MFDAICYLESEGLVHGNLSPEHVLRDPVSNRMVLVGFGHVSTESHTADNTTSDIIAAAMMLLEPMMVTDKTTDFSFDFLGIVPGKLTT